MKTLLVHAKRRRWKGSLSDIATLGREVEGALTRRLGARVGTSVRAFTKEEEYEYDTIDEFAEGSDIGDPRRLEKIILVTDNFARERPLSAEIVLSKTANEPAVFSKVRGHDFDQARGALDELVKALSRSARRDFHIGWVIWPTYALFIVAQYFFWSYVPIGHVSDFVGYLLILLASIIPLLFLVGLQLGLRWLYPQIEILDDSGPTRRRTAIRKGVLTGVGVAWGVLGPIVGLVIAARAGLN